MSDFIMDGMHVVKQYDPATYQRMVSDNWRPTDDFDTWAKRTKMGMMDYILQGEQIMTSFGVTRHGSEDSLINPDMIRDFAHQNHIPAKYFTAAVMVHEFTHTLDRTPDARIGAKEARQTEITAFAAGKAFAEKLPKSIGAPIVRMSDEAANQAKSDIRQYMGRPDL